MGYQLRCVVETELLYDAGNDIDSVEDETAIDVTFYPLGLVVLTGLC